MVAGVKRAPKKTAKAQAKPRSGGKAKAQSSAKAKRGGAKATATTTSAVSPKDAYFEALHAHLKKVDGAVGHMLARGTSEIRNEETDEFEEVDEDNLTPAHVAQLRHILLTKRRVGALEAARELVLGDQAGSDFLMFDTSFSWDVIDLLEEVAGKRAGKDASKRFDELLAFTSTIHDHDTWTHDYEDGDALVKGINKLGKAWRALLEKSDAELGIDAEYTRPGILALCADLREACDHIEDDRGRGPAPWAWAEA